MAIHDVAGLAVRHVKPILERLAVVHKLMHLTAEVLSFVDPHPELSPVLLKENERFILFFFCWLANSNLLLKEIIQISYHGNDTTGADGVHHGHTHHAHHVSHVLKVRVLSPPQEDLVTHEIGAVVPHEAPALDPAGVAAIQVHVDVGAVAAAVIGTALEAPLLIENDLQQGHRRKGETPLLVPRMIRCSDQFSHTCESQSEP